MVKFLKKITEKNFGTHILTDVGLTYQKVGVVICIWQVGVRGWVLIFA